MKQLKRSFLKLLMLFVGLFALSNVGWAAGAYIVGDFTAAGGTLNDSNTGIVMNNVDGNKFSYTFTATKAGTVKFQFRVEYSGNYYLQGPEDFSSDHIQKITSGDSNGKHATGYDNWNDKKTQFAFDCVANHKYTVYFWYEYDKKPYASYTDDGIVSTGPTAYNFYVTGTETDWNNKSDYKLNANSNYTVYTKTFSTFGGEFKIHNGSNYYGASGDGTVNLKSGEKKNIYEGNSNMAIPEGSTNVTFTVSDSNNDGVPEDVTVTYTTENVIYLHHATGTWADTNDTKFTKNGDVYTLTINNFNTNNNFKVVSNGTYYEIAGTNVTKYVGSDNYTNMCTTNIPNGSTVVFTLKLKDGTPDTLHAEVISGKGMPFYPVYQGKRITSETELGTVPSSERFFYLYGHVINNEIISPEWQMDGPFGSGTETYYTLDFTYNAHDCKADFNQQVGVMYLTKDMSSPKYAKYSEIPTSEFKTDDYKKAGMRIRATYYPNKGASKTGDEQIGGTLKFEVLDNGNNVITSNTGANAQYLPFVSLIGSNWKQREDKKVPKDLSNIPLGNSNYNGWTTSDGDGKGPWQNAWIQYDENGNPIVSRDGKTVYLNTQWPPKNEILFATEDGSGNEIILSSKELTFVPEGNAQSSTDWKKDSRFKDLTFRDNSAKYRMYKVSDLWINGTFKLWSGWNGWRFYDTSDKIDKAEWGNNWNWGHEKGEEKDQFGKINYLHEPGQVFLGIENGDMLFSELVNGKEEGKPTYFKNVYFFVDLDHPNGKGNTHNFLYFEAAKASILARSKTAVNNFERGEFRPEVLNGSTSEVISKIEIDVYTIKDVKEGNVWTQAVPASENLTTDNNAAFNAYFGKNQDFESAGKEDGLDYWYDGYGYEKSGYYYYIMTLTLTNGEKIEAKSNPFYIAAGDVNTDLTTYQLVKENATSNSYITYKKDADKIYRVTGSTSGVTSISEFTGNATQIYEIDGLWTNMILVQGAIIDNLQELFGNHTISYQVKSNSLGTQELKNFGNYYYAIYDKGATLTTSRLTSSLKVSYKIEGQDATNTSSSTATYTPTFMLPSFVKDSAKIFFDDDQDARDFTASHADLYSPEDGNSDSQQPGVTTNRHELKAQLKLNMPNIYTADNGALKAAVYNALNVGIKAYTSSDNADSQNVYVSKAIPTATEYVINYRYQSPYDWMYEDLDNPGNWYGVNRIWDIDASYYDGVINGKVPTVEARPTTIDYQAKPSFTPPNYQEKSAEYHADINLVNETWEAKLYLRKIELKNPESEDVLFTSSEDGANNYFNQDMDQSNGKEPKLAFLIKVDEMKDPVQLNPINRVVNYIELTNLDDNNSNGVENELAPSVDKYDHLIAEFTIPASLPLNDENMAKDHALLNTVLDKLHVQMAYAYYFAACKRTTSQPENGSLDTQSTMVGFQSGYQLPAIRYDHATSAVSLRGMRAVLSDDTPENVPDYTTTSTGTLEHGDDSFLLAPAYVDIKAANDSFAQAGGQLTGIKDVEGNVLANIITGKGFIDLNGNAGIIFTADGRTVYNGNSRANLPQGVYVVTLENRSVKVLVK